jgi:hypothetical protein
MIPFQPSDFLDLIPAMPQAPHRSMHCTYDAVRSESQDGNRWRFWAPIADLNGRYLRVVTLDDKNIIHNAFPDRGFRT